MSRENQTCILQIHIQTRSRDMTAVSASFALDYPSLSSLIAFQALGFQESMSAAIREFQLHYLTNSLLPAPFSF